MACSDRRGESGVRRLRRRSHLAPVDLREHNHKVKTYSRMYVTLQDDGSEDDDARRERIIQRGEMLLEGYQTAWGVDINVLPWPTDKDEEEDEDDDDSDVVQWHHRAADDDSE